MKRKRKKQNTQKSYICKIFGLIVAITVIAVSGGVLLKRTITESPEDTLMEYMNHIEKKEYEVISMVENVKGIGGSGYVVRKDATVLDEYFKE